MLMIDYTPIGFPEKFGSKSAQPDCLLCSWPDLVWAAITVGRKHLQQVIRPDTYAYFELIYRSTILYTHLQAADYRRGLWGLADTHLQQSSTYQHLGPVEKSVASYFLGLTTAKLFGDRILRLPWLLHLDTYSQHLNSDVSWKLPDLTGFNQQLDWAIMEAKGRSNQLDWRIIKKANRQVRVLTRVAGNQPDLRVGFCSYFTSVTKTLKVYLATPSIEDKNASGKELDLTLGTYLLDYYQLLFDFLNSEYGGISTLATRGDRTYRVKSITEIDMQLGLDEQVYALVKSGEKTLSEELVSTLPSVSSVGKETDERVTVGGDGVYVKLGNSWHDDTMTLPPAERVQ